MFLFLLACHDRHIVEELHRIPPTPYPFRVLKFVTDAAVEMHDHF